MSKRKYLKSKKNHAKFKKEVEMEMKFLSNLGILGKGVRSHAKHRTKTGSNVVTGIERVGIYKKKTRGVVNLGDQRVLNWLHLNANSSR